MDLEKIYNVKNLFFYLLTIFQYKDLDNFIKCFNTKKLTKSLFTVGL